MAKKVDHAQRRQEIARTALRLFSQVGYDNVSLIMIAAASGISRTVLYRYFCSKREVMDAAIHSVTDVVALRCQSVLKSGGTTPEKLEKICHVVVEEMFAHRDFVIAVFDFVVGMVRSGADMNAGINEYTAGTRNAIRLLISHGKRRGEFPAALVDERTADALYAEFESCAMRIVLNTERTNDAAKRRFSDAIHALSAGKFTL